MLNFRKSLMFPRTEFPARERSLSAQIQLWFSALNSRIGNKRRCKMNASGMNKGFSLILTDTPESGWASRRGLMGPEGGSTGILDQPPPWSKRFCFWSFAQARPQPMAHGPWPGPILGHFGPSPKLPQTLLPRNILGHFWVNLDPKSTRNG